MASVCGDLIWEVAKKNNAFLVKQFGGSTAKVQFSKEKSNLCAVHSFKHSGLTSKKTVSIQPAGEGLSVVLAMTKTKKQRKPACVYSLFSAMPVFSFPNPLDKRPRMRCCSSLQNDLPQEEEARDAVFQMLQEYGVSEEDSFDIASSSPKYVKSLVDNVRELDEHSLWSCWDGGIEKIGEEEDPVVGFKRKIYYMAKSKGDAGILLPFLESIGLKLSSAAFLARSLSSQRLPDLIAKVRFLKDMLFSSRSHKELLGRNARRMMKHLSISSDDDIQRTLSFFEKLEAKHGGLNILGHGDACFSHLIESFRELLLLSVENHFKPLVHFLEQTGVPEESARVVFLLFPPILLYDVDKDIKPRICALEKAGVNSRDIGRMLFKYPWILSSSIQDNYDKILKFFHDKKVPKSSMDIAIKSWPHLLGCATHKMEPILDQIDALGVKGKMLIPVITSSPQLLLKKPSELLEVVSFMKEIGFDGRTIGRILCRCPEIFSANVDNTLRRKVQFLTDFGILRGQLPRVIRKYPELLLLDIHQTLRPRMRYLIETGFSKMDVCSMVFKFSPLLGYSVDVVLKPKIEFLTGVMQKPLKEVVEYPRYFSYSLNKKIKCRFLVLKSRSIDCSLRDMLAKNDEKFAEQYDLVVPFYSSDAGELLRE
ncbi:uncharacterized protein LOC109841411 isoform X1 [Asparagus officinalis]|nr:uncharacterized protein LOC109841411 isoform X1 [Asparagus officinalis]XP_020265958.1 uncharacterized protein LOC109841411 isoform X1 [Asparagus officinalis]XP_020265959.1 uncharacterized protein LOC109841411 isoform X1 [Asparagus officinalis]